MSWGTDMTSWHAPPEALERYARTPQNLDEATASSVEQHLIECEACRASVAAAGDDMLHAASWSAIADVIDRPRVSVLERLLSLLGASAGTARLVAGTRGLRWGWVGAVLLSAAGATWLATSEISPGPFLAISPLVPLLAVLVAFAPISDPSGEAGVATATFGPALMLRRVITVVAPALSVVGLAAAVSPEVDATAPLWLLPGLALAAGAVALATWIRISLAAAVLAVVWLTGMVLLQMFGSGIAMVDTVVFGFAGQALSLAIAVAGCAVVVLRQDRFGTMEVQW